MNNMAIVIARYIPKAKSAKANLRYIQNRSGKDGAKITRTLFGSDGCMTREEAYRMIDEAERGTRFFRVIINTTAALL